MLENSTRTKSLSDLQISNTISSLPTNPNNKYTHQEIMSLLIIHHSAVKRENLPKSDLAKNSLQVNMKDVSPSLRKILEAYVNNLS
jgi:hypothetical protein